MGRIAVHVREMPVFDLTAISFLWRADPDGSDYTDGGGGAVEIAIDDDDEIESVREVFTLTLDTPGGDAGYGLGVVATAAVTIEEACATARQVADRARPAVSDFVPV